MTYFVIAFDRRTATIIERHDVPFEEADRAWRERNRLTRVHLDDPDIEVVLLGAESEADVRGTHGRYFEHANATAA